MSNIQDYHPVNKSSPAEFTIKVIERCRIVFGQIPVSEIAMLSHGFSKKALIALDIADRIGASLVIGEPNDLDKLRQADLPVSEKRQADYVAANGLGLPQVALWLRNGSRGASSNAMCKRMFGLPTDGRTDHPHDPSDLMRCLQFLDETQAHAKLAMMADVSPEWASLVVRWDGLVAMLREELAVGTSAPKTLAAMQACIEEGIEHD